MEGTYPIVIDGELAGKLRVEKQGSWTQFHAECRSLPGLVRISVYGGGKEAYLGVLAPMNGGLGLQKRMSPAELRAFPQEIESVERAGLAPERQPEPPKEPETPSVPRLTAEQAAQLMQTEPEEPEKPEEPEMPEADETPAAPSAPEIPEDTDGLYWYSSPDGALVCFDGTHSLIALPLGDERIPAAVQGQARTVEGRDYMVYVTRNGRIVG